MVYLAVKGKRGLTSVPGSKHPEHLWILRRMANRVRNQGCRVCGATSGLTFHHRDPKTKVSSIWEMVRAGVSVQMLEAELKKCDVLCETHHTLYDTHRQEVLASLERQYDNR